MALRIIRELRHDKRSLMLILGAPILLLTLVYFILDHPTTEITVGIINCPESYIENLYENNVMGVRCTESEGHDGLASGKFTATVSLESNKLYISINGSNVTKSEKALNVLKTANVAMENSKLPTADVTYVYGAENLTAFNNMGATLIGVLVFLFVFLLSGISFLKEKTTGTMEKLLSTPIKRWEIVVGYALGFGAITALQSVIITFYAIYILNIMMVGSIWLVLLITLLAALTALTLGILLSSAASNEFQMIQFIPLVVVPQVFFCGLFDLSPSWELIGKIFPLTYVSNALNKVMFMGQGFSEILFELSILISFIMIFMFVNILILKKMRKI